MGACLVWEGFLEELHLNWALMEYWDVDSVTSRYKAWNLRFMEHRQGMFEEQVGDGEGRVTSSSLWLISKP